MFELVKGMKIKKVKENKNPMFVNSTSNEVLIYEVTRVNKNTYGLKCIEGYMKNTTCNLCKDCPIEGVDVYGTVTRYEILNWRK